MSLLAENLNCADVLDHLEAFVDDELDNDRARAVRRHLDRCPTCAAECELAAVVATELRALPKLDPPARVFDRMRVGVRPGRAGIAVGSHGPRRLRWLAAAAAIVIPVASAVAVVRHRSAAPNDEALEAAAELRVALVCISDITRRADRMVRSRTLTGRAVPDSFRSLGRSIHVLPILGRIGEPLAASIESNREGNS